MEMNKNKITWQAVGSNVLCYYTATEEEKKTDSGLYLPEGVQRNLNGTRLPELHTILTVSSVGEYVKTVSPGDKVIVDSRYLMTSDPKNQQAIFIPNEGAENEEERVLVHINEGMIKAKATMTDREKKEKQKEKEKNNNGAA